MSTTLDSLCPHWSQSSECEPFPRLAPQLRSCPVSVQVRAREELSGDDGRAPVLGQKQLEWQVPGLDKREGFDTGEIGESELERPRDYVPLAARLAFLEQIEDDIKGILDDSSADKVEDIDAFNDFVRRLHRSSGDTNQRS